MSEPEYEHRSFRTISKSFGFSGKAAIKCSVDTYLYVVVLPLENMCKIGSSKDFFDELFLFACCFAEEFIEKPIKNTATVFHTRNDIPIR